MILKTHETGEYKIHAKKTEWDLPLSGEPGDSDIFSKVSHTGQEECGVDK